LSCQVSCQLSCQVSCQMSWQISCQISCIYVSDGMPDVMSGVRLNPWNVKPNQYEMSHFLGWWWPMVDICITVGYTGSVHAERVVFSRVIKANFSWFIQTMKYEINLS
jgi:hypothetical protein